MIVGAGSAVITASQAGNSNYLAATPVPQTLTVNCLLNVAATSGGSVTRNPDLSAYTAGSLVTLTATPSEGFGFIRWSGDASGNINPLVVTMNSNKVITASFTQRPQLLADGSREALRQDGFRLTLTGDIGAVYQIFVSTDLIGWTLLDTVTNDWGTVQYTDKAATNLPSRFYRLEQQ